MRVQQSGRELVKARCRCRAGRSPIGLHRPIILWLSLHRLSFGLIKRINGPSSEEVALARQAEQAHGSPHRFELTETLPSSNTSCKGMAGCLGGSVAI